MWIASVIRVPRLRRLLENPVTVKELRSRMRGRRAFVVLTIHLLLVSGLITLVYLAYASAASRPFGPDSRQAGKVIFFTIVMMQGFLVVFIAPAFTAGAISGEKERQTYDLLRTTLLSANAFVLGKLVSALSYVFLLIFALIPLQSIAFLLGGVDLTELLITQLVIAVSAVTFALMGLYFSSAMRSTLAASVTTFSTALLVTAGIPVFVLLTGWILGPLLFGFRTPGWLTQMSLIYGGQLLAITNLPLTLVVSEVFLLQFDAIFYFTEIIDGRTVHIFSPWPFYSLLYTLLALLLYWLTVRRVRRIADK
jgi:ABC-2 type transport system permease protein